MELMKEIKNRVSARSFRNKSVEKDVITRILEAGRVSISAKNRQPWRFIVIDDPIMKKKGWKSCIRSGICRKCRRNHCGMLNQYRVCNAERAVIISHRHYFCCLFYAAAGWAWRAWDLCSHYLWRAGNKKPSVSSIFYEGCDASAGRILGWQADSQGEKTPEPVVFIQPLVASARKNIFKAFISLGDNNI